MLNRLTYLWSPMGDSDIFTISRTRRCCNLLSCHARIQKHINTALNKCLVATERPSYGKALSIPLKTKNVDK